MDLSRVNQFSLLPHPSSAYPGSETGLVENIPVWQSDQFISSKLSLDLVSEFCFAKYSGAAQWFHAGCVCYICVAGSPLEKGDVMKHLLF